MKKIVLALALVILVVLSGCSSTSATISTNKLIISAPSQIYTDTNYGFSINYPQGWNKIEESPAEAQSIPIYENAHLAVQFIKPVDVNVVVEVRELSQMTETYEQWVQDKMSTINATMKSIQSGLTTLSGYLGYEVTYTDKIQNMEVVEIWTLVNGNIYGLVGMVSQPANFSDYSPTIQQMIDSFKITTNQTISSQQMTTASNGLSALLPTTTQTTTTKKQIIQTVVPLTVKMTPYIDPSDNKIISYDFLNTVVLLGSAINSIFF